MLFVNPNNNAKEGKTAHTCVRCQKDVNPAKAKHITIDNCYNVIDETQGDTLIGQDCWKLVKEGR